MCINTDRKLYFFEIATSKSLKTKEELKQMLVIKFVE